MATTAAHTFTALIAIVILFQVALASGAPWGSVTWGGKYPGKLPPAMRGAAVFSAGLLILFAVIVEVRAGVILPGWRPATRVAIWAVVAYLVLGTVANTITPSRWERILWLPVVLAALACSLVVALS